MDIWITLVIAIGVGMVGSMLGIGGGVLIIPILTLFFDVPIKTAIGASIVSIIATSAAAGAVYVGYGMTNVRLGMVLEIATTTGALIGGIAAGLVSPEVLQGVFGIVLLYMIFTMRRLPTEEVAEETGLMDAHYIDPLTGEEVAYGVRHLPVGGAAGFASGTLSGLLGIGGGVVNVPIMVLAMRLPLKASIATSNFMIGVTAATSAVVYFARGDVDPSITVMTVLGIMLGALLGPRIGRRIRTSTLKWFFQILLIVFAVQMLWKAFVG